MPFGAKRNLINKVAALGAALFLLGPSLAMAKAGLDLSDYRRELKSSFAKKLSSMKKDEAVAAIQAEIQKSPKKAELQRLLANTYRRQGRYEESIEPMKKWLKAQPEDGVASLYLAEAQVRTNRTAEAQKTLEGVLSGHPGTVVGDLAATLIAQLTSGNTIEPLDPPASAISAKKFVELAPAKQFKAKNYASAAAGFAELAQQHPREAMVLRYWAASLSKDGHPDEALPIFERASKFDPLGIALHEDWGSALKKAKMKTEAEKHLSYAKTYDPAGPYAKKADKKLAKKKKSPLKIKGGFGYTYDVNYKKRSNVAEQRKGADIDAGFWAYNLGGTLTLHEKDEWTIKGDASLNHTYLDSGLSDKNKMTHNIGLSVGRKTSMFGKPVNIVMRNGGTHNAKHGVYNGLGYKNTVKFEWDWTEHYKPSLSNNIAFAEKDDTGSRPEYTNSEGWSEDVTLDHKFLPDPKNKDLFYSFGTKYQHVFAQGDNNIADKVSLDTGVGIPLVEKLTAEVGATYTVSQFPKMGFPNRTRQKRGDDWKLTAQFVREINEHWELEFDYTYQNMNNRNDKSQYDDHIYALVGNFKY